MKRKEILKRVASGELTPVDALAMLEAKADRDRQAAAPEAPATTSTNIRSEVVTTVIDNNAGTRTITIDRRRRGMPGFDDIVEAAAAGVNRSTLDAYRERSPGLSVEEIVDLVNHGVSPEAWAGYAAAGGVDTDGACDLFGHGVSPEAWAGYAAAGGVDTDGACDLFGHGVSPEAWAEYAAALGPDVDVDMVCDLCGHGVSPEGAAAFLAADADLTIDQIVEAVSAGVRPEDLVGR